MSHSKNDIYHNYTQIINLIKKSAIGKPEYKSQIYNLNFYTQLEKKLKIRK